MMAYTAPAPLAPTVAALRNGEQSLETYIDDVCDRIKAAEPQIASLLPEPGRRERLLREARALAARFPDPVARPPLYGALVGVKDIIHVDGFVTRAGSAVPPELFAGPEAACIGPLRAAGALILGKTVTTEFAGFEQNGTRNPHNPAHTPGGSSSGSAAAVAAGLCVLALGSQTVGSVIRPAAFCGVVGYKPSFGTIHRAGMKIMSESLDTVGVMARSVADCARFVGAVAGRDLGDPEAKPERAPRVGLCRSPSWPLAAPETGALLDRVAATLGRAGATVRDHELPPAFDTLVDAHPVVQWAESARALGWEMQQHPDLISPVLREGLERGLAYPAEALDRARGVFRNLQEAFPAALGDLDVLITPAAPGEAPEGIGWTGNPAFNFIWTSLHVPCITVPADAGPKGLPLGIQIVGRRGEDRATLAWAQWVAAALG
jgi:Asp-tRNA(Asn)/Glu-tRNA(Gln) amidotransferase A subunit family amidase